VNVRAANLALKFLLELAAIAAFAYWGSTVGHGAVSVLVAIAAPALAVVLWGTFAAPKAEHRLAAARRIPFELAVFGLAVAALVAAGAPLVAALLGVLVSINGVLLTVFNQWES
jgi:uncharacterized protein DUF2568